ncbi:hypothetical protein ASPZODRAFT_120195, partial [Penicilliopsis zonata CBS 506.65]
MTSESSAPPEKPGTSASFSRELDSDGVGKTISPAGSAATGAAARSLRALAAVDVILQRIDSLISTADGQERLLGMIGHLAHTLHHFLVLLHPLRLRIAKYRKNANTEPPSGSPSLLALSALISETRYTLRLFGLVQLWAWGSEAIHNPPADRTIRAITLAQVASNIIYQILENVPYLASKGVGSKRFIERRGGFTKWDLWSTRFWLGHILLEFLRLWRQSVLMRRQTEGTTGTDAEESEEDKETQKEDLRRAVRAWRKSLLNNFIWAPLCLHWSFERGIGVPGSVTGFFSFLAGTWALVDAWRDTA